jgi:glycerol-3-phosphate dehydrogenase
MAHHLDDVLVRRTRSLLADRDATEAAMVPTAALLATELGWDRARTASEIDALQAVIDDERASLR